MVDYGVEQVLLLLWECLQESVDSRLGCLGSRQRMHSGFLAKLLEIGIQQQLVDGVPKAIQIQLKAHSHCKPNIGCQFLAHSF